MINKELAELISKTISQFQSNLEKDCKKQRDLHEQDFLSDNEGSTTKKLKKKLKKKDCKTIQHNTS